MADSKIENTTAALALLPVQTNKEISAQDIRDIVNSVPFVGSGKWNDIQGPVQEGTGASALTIEAYRDTPFRMYFTQHNQADQLHFTYQMSHDWDGTAVKPHMHIIPMSSGSGLIHFAGQYAWVQVNGAALPANASWTPFTGSLSVTPADQYIERIISFGEVQPLANPKASDILCIEVERVPATDTYETSKSPGTAAANVAIVSVDCHYRIGKLGTTNEFGE